MVTLLQNKLSELQSKTTDASSTYSDNFTIDFNQWIEHFESLSTLSLLLDARNTAP
jgi:hypothetical protein